MDHSVPIDRLPDGLRFPPEYADRIDYDTHRRRLTFHGFMSKAEYDALSRLSTDWTYRCALEELFRQSTPEDDIPRRGLRRLLGALVGSS